MIANRESTPGLVGCEPLRSLLPTSSRVPGESRRPQLWGLGPSLWGGGCLPLGLVGVVLSFCLSTPEVAADRFGGVAGNDS